MEIPQTLRTAFQRLSASPDDLGDDDGPGRMDFMSRTKEFMREAHACLPAWKEIVRRGTLIERRMEAEGLIRRIDECQLCQSDLPKAMQGENCKTFADWIGIIGQGYDEQTETAFRAITRVGDLEDLKERIFHLDRVLAARSRRVREELAAQCDLSYEKHFDEFLDGEAEAVMVNPVLLELYGRLDAIFLDGRAVHADFFRDMMVDAQDATKSPEDLLDPGLTGLGCPAEAKLAAAQLIEHLEGLNEGESKSAVEGDSAYRPAVELWRDKFDTYKKFQLAFEKIPESTIRRRRPRKNRLEIHAGDWVKYFTELDKKKAELLDEETHQEFLADIEAQIAEARSKKSRRK